jgi:hypothetical protein
LRDGRSKHLPGKSIGAQQGALAFADLGDVFLIHFGGDPQRLWLANPKQGRGGIHNLAHLGITAQNEASRGRAHNVIIQPALRCISRSAYGAGFGFGAIKRGAGRDIARDQGAHAGQIFLRKKGAGFGFFSAVARFAIIQLRHGLAGLNAGTFFDQHSGDARTQGRANLGPMHRLYIAGGIDRLHGGAGGGGGHRDGGRQAAPEPGPGQAEQKQH